MSNIAEHMALMKDAATQSYELERTASTPGKKNALTGIVGADADFHIQDQHTYLRMIAFVRMMERNSPVVAAAQRRLMANVNVGGMSPVPNTGDKEMNAHLRGVWDEFAKDPDQCDATGRYNFQQMADIVFCRVIFDGDCFATPEENGSIFGLEAHRVQTPHRGRKDRGVCGVQLDALGKRVDKYWITKKPFRYGESVSVNDVEETDAYSKNGWRNVFHMYRPERFSLHRGITSLAPVATTENRRDDAEFAQLLKLQIASCTTFIREFDNIEVLKLLSKNDKYVKKMMDEGPATFRRRDDAGYEMKTIQQHPGRQVDALPGTKLRMETPDIPGESALEFNRNLLMYLSMNLDLPLITLLLDARDANFSSYRNVFDQARLHFELHQGNIASMFSSRVYANLVRVRAKTDPFIQKFMERHKLRDVRDVASVDNVARQLTRHDWVNNGWKYIHPVDDAMGHVIQLSNSMMSINHFAQQRYGITGEQLVDNVISDREYAILNAIQAAQRIESTTGVPVDWQYLWPPPNATGIGMQLIDDSDERRSGEEKTTSPDKKKPSRKKASAKK